MTKTELNKKTKEELVDSFLELLTENTEAKKTLESHEATIKDQSELIETLTAAADKAASKQSNPVVKAGKDKFEVVIAKFNLMGDSKQYTADDLKTDSKLVERVLKVKGQGILKPLK